MNSFSDIERYSTYKNGKNQIDPAFTPNKIIQYIQGNKLVNCNEIIVIDYRRFIFDLDAKQQFELDTIKYDQIDTRLLHLSNRVYRETFKKKLEKYLKESKLYKKV